MVELSADDFSEFFNAVHGVNPFPWQSRLARQVIEKGEWPSLLDLPTGTGKTATIDIAVFHLACEAERGPKRKAPLRILFVIDRRIVVDAAFQRARKIADAIKIADGGILENVANRLQSFAGDNAPVLQVTRLRGGMPQERDWARSPAQPLVGVSTVDQVGSRLFFRGYGVSQRMWPVHAGLVGSDALWLLDEVHLSTPLDETLDAIVTGHPKQRGGVIAEMPRLAPFTVVRLSATPGESTEKPFRLSDEDRTHASLSRRLESRKLAKIETWSDGKAVEEFSKAAMQLTDLITESSETKTERRKRKQPTAIHLPVRRLAVVVNHVGRARKVFEELKEKVGERAKVVLLTGRIRPLDRDRIMEDKAIASLLATPNRNLPERPIILVATQTIEAGADFDVDALVTEIAPLDSLRQRFGRLDRLGERGESRAVILCPSSKKPKDGEDNDWTPIFRLYDDSAYETGKWLGKPGSEVDFGIDVFALKIEEATKNHTIKKLIAPRCHAPVLFPPYAELWAATSPPPLATPEPALFLHGPKKRADVQVVWRADVDLEDKDASNRSLRCCPPSSLEAISVPIWAVRAWLRAIKIAEGVADVPETELSERGGTQGQSCLRYPRRDDSLWRKVFAHELKPGDTIVVPCSYGGCDRWGWNPDGDIKPVVDLGTQAHYYQRLKGALRVTRETLTNALDQEANGDSAGSFDEIWHNIQRLIQEDGGDLKAETIRAGLAEIDALPETWRQLLKAMEGEKRGIEIEFCKDTDHESWFVLYVKNRLKSGVLPELCKTELDDESSNDAVTERDDSWATGVRVELLDHLDHVEAKSRDLAQRSGLDEKMTKLLALAGRMHDLGKADHRFQTDLYGVSTLTRLSLNDIFFHPLLAKNTQKDRPRSHNRAVSKNFRHEALSIALAQEHHTVKQLNEEESDLVLWLVGTHHGHGRPFFPPCEDCMDGPTKGTTVSMEIDEQKLVANTVDAPIRMDQGWFERGARLLRRFGPWELARLEAILRLADHAASADEQMSGNFQD